MANKDPYGGQNNSKKGKPKGAPRAPREHPVKRAMRQICRYGPPFLYAFSFLEMDNWLQAGALFIWQGAGWGTIWIGKADFFLVYGLGVCGYYALWAIGEFLMDKERK